MARAPRAVEIGEVFNAAVRVVGKPLAPEIMQELRTMVGWFNGHLRRLTAAGESGNRQRARGQTYWLLRSDAARVLCFLRAYPRGGRKLTWGEAKAIAQTINPRRGSDEPVTTWTELKPEGGKRQLVSFGPKARAAQLMCRHVLEARCGQSPFEYSRKRRGRDAVIEAVFNTHRNGGIRHLIETDVRSFFPSFDKERMPDLLPLPKAVTRHSILIADHTHIHSRSFTSRASVRAGLPQGSLASPFVASLLLRPTLEALNASFCSVFIDNILLGERSLDEVQTKADALASLLERHPAGPLSLKHRHLIVPDRPNNILGYNIHRQRRPDRWLRVKPSDQSKSRLYRRAFREMVFLGTRDLGDLTEEMSTRWAGSMGAWRDRATGAGLMDIALVADVLPVANAFYRKRKPTFASFADMQRYITTWFDFLPPPHGPQRTAFRLT